MKILIPVAAYHEYNTGRYVEKALKALGHDAQVITQAEFYEDHPDADLFFGVDSAGPLDFPEKHMTKTVMWFIDSRHNNNPDRRTPDDDTNAKRLADGGGWVFQAQKKDWMRNLYTNGVARCTWLPLAADARVWVSDLGAKKLYNVGFGGNIWCQERRALLDRIAKEFTLGTCTGTPELLAAGYNASRVGFNVSGWYGSDIAYDVNMRVFEVMACGIPLVTNQLPDLQELGILPEHHCLTFTSPDDALAQIQAALQQNERWRREMGDRARRMILKEHTYEVRMEEALEILENAGMIGDRD